MSVNVSMFAGVGAQFFDDNGNPLSGGKIYTYAAGTTTPLATYTTSAGNIARANPIVLDAAGRVDGGGEIWVTSTSVYKFVLEDSTSNLIGTYDNVPGALASSFAADLANATNPALGDALVGYKQSNSLGVLANATARTVHDKLQERVSLFDFMTSAEIAAARAGVTPPDVTTAFTNALAVSRNIYIPSGTYKISEVEIGNRVVLEGGGTYQTLIYVMKANVGTNRGLYYRSNTEAESGMILKQFSLEAENYAGLGKHSYGLNIANVAHAYIESVHCVGFEIGFYLEDSLINTFMRCRVNGNKWGVYIDGTEPLGGGDGASKNCFIDLKATNNGDNVDGGSAILITGNSAYQNVFINPDIEGNYFAIIIDLASNEGPNIFISPYFENTSTLGGNGQNLIRCGTGKNISMINPIFGTVAAGNTYFDLNNYDGTIDLTQASSNSQSTRIPPPKKGRMELIKDDQHNIASTNIMSMVRYRQTFTPTMQGGGVIAGANVASYIYGSTAGSGETLRNTFDADPNNPGTWTSGTGTTGQTDPLGGTTAVRTNGPMLIQRAVGASSGKVVAQCFVKVVDSTPGEFQLVYYNGGIARKRQVYAFTQTTDWMLLYVEFDLTGAASPSINHGIAFEDVGTKILIWWPQIVQGTDQPQPILPLDSPQGFGAGVDPTFSTSLRKVGETSYELPQIVGRILMVASGAGAAESFRTLVDSTSPARGRVFDLIIREGIGSDVTITTYRVALAYADETTSADSIVLISTHEMGSTGYASRITPTVSSLTANSNKTITLTSTDVVTVNATIREIT